MKTKKKTYYVLYLKRDDSVYISTTKQYIADILGVHLITVSRHLENSNKWIHSDFIVWKRVNIHTAKTGFAI